MKKKLKRLTSLLLAAIMASAMCLTGFAASSGDEGVTGSITIDKAAYGETYTVYQIFEVTYKDVSDEPDEDGNYSGGTYAYKVTGAWEGFFAPADEENGTPAGKGYAYIKLDENGYIADSSGLTEGGAATAETFAKLALEYAKENGITGTSGIVSTERDANKGNINVTTDPHNKHEGYYNITFSDLNLGYYLVDTTLGSLCFLDTTNPSATIREKNGSPTLTKEADHTSVDDADKITYTITVTDIAGATNLILHDYMDKELSLREDDGNYNVTVTLYLKDPEDNDYDEDTDKITLIHGTDYTVKVLGDSDTCSKPVEDGDDEWKCTFEVNFTSGEDGNAGYDFSGVSDDGYLVIVYVCNVDEKGDAFTSDEEDLDNEAYLTFGTASHSVKQTVEIPSYGFEIYKFTTETVEDANNPGQTTTEKTPLAGAEFTLTKTTEAENEEPDEGTTEETLTAYFLEETLTEGEEPETTEKTIYLFEGWLGKDEEVPSGYTTTVTSASDGYIYIEGLAEGEYILTETKAPAGYNMLTDTLTLTIASNSDGAGGFTVTYKFTSSDDDPIGESHIVGVENASGDELPDAGGPGTVMFYIIGLALIMGCAVSVIVRRKTRSL